MSMVGNVDTSKIFWVVCITLFLVVGFNAMIYFSVVKRGGANQIDLFKRATDQARRPWSKEEDALKELSDLVEGLKKPDEKPPNSPSS